MTLGQKLKILLKENGMTQEDLAEKLEVSRQAVGKFGIFFRPGSIRKSEMNALHLMIRYSKSLRNRGKAEERNMRL